MSAFSTEITADQLRNTTRADLSVDIQAISSGNPAATDAVVKSLARIARQKQRRISRDLFYNEMPALLNVTVGEIRRRTIVPDELFHVFYRLAILRRFDVDLPTGFLYFDGLASTWETPFGRTALIRQMIHDTGHVVRFDNVRRGYEIELFVRRAFVLHMLHFSRDEYIHLNLLALDYYDTKLNRSPAQAWIVVERLFHLAGLLALSPRYSQGEDAIGVLIQQFERDIRICAAADPVPNLPGVALREDLFRYLWIELSSDFELAERLSNVSSGKAQAALMQVLEKVRDEQKAEMTTCN